ncbi:XRE family transcriptional regulator [Candidatus Palauibacter sp.]|uniref:XRE family transcriptional regulator n=1 Tax=Candidatus Palauibacter sp. TaxID=3101350 RepID=UPI003B52F710
MTLESLLGESADNAGTTSFFGRAGIRDSAPLSVIMVGGALSFGGTSSAEPTKIWGEPYVRDFDTTAGGPGRDAVATQMDTETETTRKAVSELRRISGLTWEQLAGLFGVSRRSVHFWASGKPLNATNHERLMRVLDVVRDADRGTARSTRAALLDARGGTSPFEMLADQQFLEAHLALGRGRTRLMPALTPLSEAAQTARKPLSPDQLYDAKGDRVHREPGRARAARTARGRRRGRG